MPTETSSVTEISAHDASAERDGRRSQTSQFLAEAGPVLAGRAYRVRRAVNTFLAFPFLFDLVIKDRHFTAFVEGRTKRDLPYLFSRLLQKSLWFWPRIIDAKPWVEGRTGKRQQPDNFIALDAHSSRALCDAVERYARRTAPRFLTSAATSAGTSMCCAAWLYRSDRGRCDGALRSNGCRRNFRTPPKSQSCVTICFSVSYACSRIGSSMCSIATARRSSSSIPRSISSNTCVG